jgi:hypothetical protein
MANSSSEPLFPIPAIVYPIPSRSGTNAEGNAMRLTVIIAVAAILVPAALTARPAAAPQAGIEAVPTDLSAAKTKKKTPAKPKEEYLKAAPGAGPSGPATKR